MSESDPGLGYSNLSFVITNQLMPNTAGEENGRVIIFFLHIAPGNYFNYLSNNHSISVLIYLPQMIEHGVSQ
jgi:hypothetical protein